MRTTIPDSIMRMGLMMEGPASTGCGQGLGWKRGCWVCGAVLHWKGGAWVSKKVVVLA